MLLRLLAVTLLTITLSSCETVKRIVDPKHEAGRNAICVSFEEPINDLNDALLIDGGPQSIDAGTVVIVAYDEGCPYGR